MAKQVKLGKGKEFVFAAPKAGGFASTYPWDQWFSPDPKEFPSGLVLIERSVFKSAGDGDGLVVSEKKDYDVPTNHMVPKLHTAARRRYKVVQISRHDADGKRLVDSLIIRARDMTPDERAEEDAQRVVEKAEKTARTAHEKALGREMTTAEAEVWRAEYRASIGG